MNSSISRAIAWAIFLSMSWTWCIGMFLPVILLRDLGWAGFLVFAIPNCLGAAAMGWVLRDGEQSRRMVDQHESACVWFTLVTIVFHVFFAGWLIRQIAGPSVGLWLAASFGIFWLILQWRGGGKFLAAILVLVASLLAIGWGIQRGELPYVAEPIPHSPTTLATIDAAWLAPACIFGFLLCPYLDLTFHAARQGCSVHESRGAFTVGFCVIFPLVLLGTAAYSGRLVAGLDRRIYPQLAMMLSAYFIIHSGFTVAAHSRQLAVRASRIGMGRLVILGICAVGAVLLGIAVQGRVYGNLRAGEIIYRGFLGFYGLAFPAYVWLCMVPPRRSVWRVAFSVAAATPMFWLGFVEQRTIWLLPGVLIPLATKWILTPPLPAGAPPSAGSQPAPAAETGR